MWILSFIISIGCLAAIAFAAFAINNSSYAKKHKFSLFNTLVAGVFLSAIVMFFPINFVLEEVTPYGVWRAFLLSVLNAMQIFAGGYEFENMKESLFTCPEWFDMFYQIWAATLLVLAPVFTFGFVLSLFKNLSATARYVCSYFKKVYVFSELNERSMALANDIKLNNKNAVIVFSDVFAENEESSFELIDKAKKMHAICFKKDILVVNFKIHSEKSPIYFFTIGVDENKNLNQALKLIETFKNRENTHIYVFSTKVESEILLSSAKKGVVKVRRINEARSLINRVLYERGEIIFNSVEPNSDGTKDISAVVVGMGRHGTEMIKALAWFGQMDGYKLEINGFDKDKLAEEKFIAAAPELMSEYYNGVAIDGEAQYKISIHSRMDVETISFADEIAKIKNATYVLVALGNDDVNISTAIKLRMYFERMKIHPVIQAIVYNSQQKNALEGIKNFKGQEYKIDFIGDLESSYTENVIIDSELEKDALQRHMSYVSAVKKTVTKYLEENNITEDELWAKITLHGQKKDKGLTKEEENIYEAMLTCRMVEQQFWQYEYNYRSSVASAIHMRARIKCDIPGAGKKSEELTAEERNIIEALEHKRWNAYMRAEGYIFSGSNDASTRNDLAKMHHDLVDFSSLSEEEKRKDSQVGTK